MPSRNASRPTIGNALTPASCSSSTMRCQRMRRRFDERARGRRRGFTDEGEEVAVVLRAAAPTRGRSPRTGSRSAARSRCPPRRSSPRRARADARPTVSAPSNDTSSPVGAQVARGSIQHPRADRVAFVDRRQIEPDRSRRQYELRQAAVRRDRAFARSSGPCNGPWIRTTKRRLRAAASVASMAHSMPEPMPVQRAQVQGCGAARTRRISTRWYDSGRSPTEQSMHVRSNIRARPPAIAALRASPCRRRGVDRARCRSEESARERDAVSGRLRRPMEFLGHR